MGQIICKEHIVFRGSNISCSLATRPSRVSRNGKKGGRTAVDNSGSRSRETALVWRRGRGVDNGPFLTIFMR